MSLQEADRRGSSQPRVVRSRCTLNAVIVSVDPAVEVQVGVRPYVDEDQLRELCSSHRGTHLVRRGRDGLQVIPVAKGAEPLGDEIRTTKPAEAPSLLAALTLEAFLRHFLSFGQTITDHRPLRVLSVASR